MTETPATYAEQRQRRRDEPGFLSAKNFPNGADVVVTDVGVGVNSENAKFRAGEEYAYWVVDTEGQPSGSKIRESATMKDKLDDLNIENPVGRKFMLTSIPVQGNPDARQWAIARAL